MTSITGRRIPPAIAHGPAVAPADAAVLPPHRRVWQLAATTVVWGTSLWVVALWVAGAGVQGLLGFDAESLNSLGRITGLVSANLLLFQVLLMARVPIFEKGFGRDRITRMHRLVGFWSFFLLLAHIALLVAGYAAQAAINPFVQLWEFTWDYPGMLLATAGTLLLVMVVLTSIRRARRALRYESWHLLHLYGYLGVGLAIPHMLWTGADFVGNTAATVYWWSLWAVTAAAVIAFRIVRPIVRTMRHDIRVHSVERDGARGVRVRMSGRRLARLGARPGQFFVWRFLDGPGWTRGHPFSLAAAPTADGLEISARIVGDGTSRLTGLRPGTRVAIEGPYGEMTGSLRTGTTLLMIGAGAGVAPLVALLESEAYPAGGAVLLTRDHSDDELLQGERIRRLVAERGLRHLTVNGTRSPVPGRWLPATHDAWGGADILRHIDPHLATSDVYICGPIAWMDAVCADLRAAGVPRERIHTEAFTV